MIFILALEVFNYLAYIFVSSLSLWLSGLFRLHISVMFVLCLHIATRNLASLLAIMIQMINNSTLLKIIIISEALGINFNFLFYENCSFAGLSRDQGHSIRHSKKQALHFIALQHATMKTGRMVWEWEETLWYPL